MSARLIHMLHATRCLSLGLLAVACALVRAVADRAGQMISHQPDWSIDNDNRRSTRRPLFASLAGREQRLALLLLIGLLWSPQATLAAIEPGTRIDNIATVTVNDQGVMVPIDSNLVSFVTRSPAVIEFLQYAPSVPTAELLPVAETFFDDGSSYQLAPPPAEIATQPVPLVPTEVYYGGESIFLRLTDRDQKFARKTILLTVSATKSGDNETLRLTETGPNTGVFTGYLPTSLTGTPAADGSLLVTEDSHLNAHYTDPADNSDTTTDAALVDPFGYVFDSTTGELIDGAIITLWDVDADDFAIVFGDDGVSRYPATVETGDTVVDEGGTSYTFNPGGFRFPFINPGTYRLLITPPAGYTAPSVVTDATLQTLPGAPFALVAGSRGEDFPINPGPAIRIDIPIDPATGGNLTLQKEASKKTVAIGDFLQYQLTLENSSFNATVPTVTLDDILPQGFRYQSGSLTVDGTQAADPSISDDGRTLQIGLGDLPPEGSMEIRYVVEVAAGTKLGKAINRATATDGLGRASNQASAIVQVKEDLLRSHAILAGQVFDGGCDVSDLEKNGLPGVRIYLEDGTYNVTDERGMYHFEGIEPGIHVVQVDTTTLPTGYEMIPCEETSQFSGRTFSQFVDLQGGTLWRADFYAAPQAPPSGEISLAMTSELDGKHGLYRIHLQTTSQPAENLRLTVMLPGESTYLAKSSRQDGEKMPDPSAFGPSITYRLGDVPAGWQTEILLRAKLDRQQPPGDLISKALLTFDSAGRTNQRTPMVETSFRLDETIETKRADVRLYPRFPTFVAELQEADRAMLDKLAAKLKDQEIIRVDIVGHTDDVPITPRSRHIFSDNFALSKARAASVAKALAEQLGVSHQKMTTSGMADTMPVADNATATGRARNRRVDLLIQTNQSVRKTQLEPGVKESGPQTATVTGADPTLTPAQPVSGTTATEPAALSKPPQIDKQWLAQAQPGVRLVWPQPGYVPVTPSTKIMVQHQRGHKVKVTLNSQPVPPLNYDGLESRKDGSVAVSTWRGVDLQKGENQVQVEVHDAAGQRVERFTEQIYYSDTPAKVELIEEQCRLTADGVTPPKLVLRLTDKQGHPVRPELFTDISVTPPYQTRSANAVAADLEDQAATSPNRIQTGQNGYVELYLAPTSLAGRVAVTVHLADGPQIIETWLKPAMRDWILVGFAQGTLGYNTLDGNTVSLKDAGLEDNSYTDGRAKFFAKGAIKGEWLLTMAYDSDKADLDGETLHQQIDPDTYYPLYGDNTQQDYEAASAENLYIKLERDQFYALFGDFDTGLNITELSRYSRNLNGFKTEWHSDHLEVTAFASETKQAFVKDEIRGDGTSGLYRLSADPVVINSEQIVIETRGRLHDEVIVNVESLARHTDYEIDYDDGTLFFKQPIPSRDADFNPVYIIARYETVASDDAQLNYGGRAAIKLMDERVEIGASYIHEEAGTDEGDLIGVDATVQITEHTTLHLEAAQTDTEETGVKTDGNAYLAEVEHSSQNLEARAYYRQQDEDFGLDQQNISESGTRKVGLAANYRATDRVEVGGEIYRQDNLETDASRDVAEADVSYGRNNWKVRAGYREARDEFESGEEERSSQALLGADVTTLEGKLTLHADHEQSLGDQDENSDFPTRTVFGADYKISERLTLFAEQEYTWGEKRRTEGTRAGFSILPWTGGTFTTSMERQMNEDGSRVAALLGLQQKWQVTERWSLDASLDRNQTLRDSNGATFDSDATSATSGEDFTSVSVGSNFRGETWSWDNRVEVRDAETDRRWGVSTALITETEPGVAYSGKAQVFMTETEDGDDSLSGDVRFGLVFRPTDSRWILLDRFDFYFDQEDGSSDQESWRLVNNLNANYKPNRKFQVSLQYGVKYVSEKINGQSYDGVTDLVGTELRYNFSKRWDAGLHASLLHSWNSAQFEYSTGISIGYAAMKNTWISIGYNLFGFEDEDFSAAHYTAQGPFIRFRVKFDQQTVREAAEWMNR